MKNRPIAGFPDKEDFENEVAVAVLVLRVFGGYLPYIACLAPTLWVKDCLLWDDGKCLL